jgi:uncharacterized protein (TIGR04255 family)
VEVVCEFRFDVEGPNDLTVPGRFYERVKTGYPQKEEVHQYGVRLEFSQKELQQQLRTKILGMRYKSVDGKDLLTVAPNLLAIHRLAPYTGWEVFFPAIERAYETFREIAEPKSIERIGLRYIDRVIIPKSPVEMSDYFKMYPETPKDLGEVLVETQMRLGISFCNERDILAFMMYPAPETPEGSVGFQLDWDYFLSKPREFDGRRVLDWVNEAHRNTIDAFFKSITDQCVVLFGGCE